MTMFGAMYYIVPRLVGREWPSATMIRWHFWLAASGIAIMVATLTLGGFLQGLELNDPQSSFLSSLQVAAPFRLVRAGSGILLSAAHLVFAALFVWMLLDRKREGAEASGPTYLSAESRPAGEPEIPAV
jgi:cytochrome c oxidase cbb3-type subunit 1